MDTVLIDDNDKRVNVPSAIDSRYSTTIDSNDDGFVWPDYLFIADDTIDKLDKDREGVDVGGGGGDIRNTISTTF